MISRSALLLLSRLLIAIIIAKFALSYTFTIMADKKQELKIELTPEVALGNYANLAVIAHTPGEFFIDFIAVSPNMPQARVNTRVIMNLENAKNLLFALRDNIQKYENTFGEIEHKVARNNAPAPENPFQA